MALTRQTIPPIIAQPMSIGVQGGPLIFLSGLSAIHPATGARWRGSAIEEAVMVLTAMQTILEGQGSSMDHVVKLHVFLYSLLELDNINTVCRRFFKNQPPARTACGATLLDGAKVEFDCVALAGAAP